MLLLEQDAYIRASSTDSVTLALGSAQFQCSAAMAWPIDMIVSAVVSSAVWGVGHVAAVSSATVEIVFTAISGSGAHSSWTLGGAATFRATDGQSYNHPSAPGPYEPVIQSVGPFATEMIAGGVPQVGEDGSLNVGRGQTVYGRAVMVNGNGVIDHLQLWDIENRTCTIKEIVDPSAPYSAASAILTVKTVHAAFPFQSVTLTFDGTTLDRPLQTRKYEGTNSGSQGVEGTPDTIGGQPVIQALGEIFNLAPPPANAPLQIHQLGFRRIESLDAGYLDGLEVSLETAARTSLSALQGALVSSTAIGYYLGSTADGAYAKPGAGLAGRTFTVDMKGHRNAGGYDPTAAGIAGTVVVEIAGLTTAQYSTADLAALAAETAVLGLPVAEESTMSEVLDEVMASVHGALAEDRGILRLHVIRAPDQAPTAAEYTLKVIDNDNPASAGTFDIGDIEQLETPPPVASVTVFWGKNQTILRTLSATVTAERQAVLTTDWRRAVYPPAGDAGEALRAGIKERYPEAGELKVYTRIAHQAAAEAFAQLLWDIYSVKRRAYQIPVEYSQAAIEAARLNAVCRVQHPRFNLQAGKNFIVTRVEHAPSDNRLIQTVWGAP